MSNKVNQKEKTKDVQGRSPEDLFAERIAELLVKQIELMQEKNPVS